MSMTSAIARLAPLPIYRVLKGEHDEVNMLFESLEVTPNTATGRTALFKKLSMELLSHAHAEQATVYDQLKGRIDDPEFLEHSEREHREAETGLRDLEQMDIASPAWLERLAEVKASVQHHVEHEENVLFDKMRAVLSDEEAKEMGKAFVEAKRNEMQMLKEGGQPTQRPAASM